MRILLGLFFSLLICTQALGQCIANAGSDTIVCIGWNGLDQTVLGGIPAASGGVPPYTFNWTTSEPVGLFGFTASDFLDDTTLANPELLSYYEDAITFILTVTDSTGESCSDSILLRFSTFASHLGIFSMDIQSGDTASWEEPNVFGGIPPLDILWVPNDGMIDSTGWGFSAAPDQSNVYGVIVTDSAGCTVEGAPFVYVNVLPTSTQALKESSISIYPNPTDRGIWIDLPYNDQRSQITILNAAGATIQRFTTSDKRAYYDVSHLASGQYHMEIRPTSGQVQKLQFVVR